MSKPKHREGGMKHGEDRKDDKIPTNRDCTADRKNVNLRP